MLADAGAREHYRAVADPRTVADHNFSLGLYLLGNRGRDVFVTVVLIGYVDVMSCPNIVTNLNSKMTDDPAPPPNQTTIANAHHGIGYALLPWHHACTKCHAWPDHGVTADVDVVLVVDRIGRETDDASVPESPELPASMGGWSDGAM